MSRACAPLYAGWHANGRGFRRAAFETAAPYARPPRAEAVRSNVAASDAVRLAHLVSHGLQAHFRQPPHDVGRTHAGYWNAGHMGRWTITQGPGLTGFLRAANASPPTAVA